MKSSPLSVIMKSPFSRINKCALFVLGCTLLALASCGGGSKGENQNGPANLFPNGVSSGQLSINGDLITLTITFPAGDFYQPASYTGKYRSQNATEESEAVFTEVNGYLRQTNATQPGHIALFFQDDSSVNKCLFGNIVIEIPASGAVDAAKYRTGIVESTSDFYFKQPTAGTSVGTSIQLSSLVQGSPVRITWGAQNEGNGAPEAGGGETEETE